MAFKKSASALALFLFVALLGGAAASALVRREAPDTNLSAAGDTATVVDVATNETGNPSLPAVEQETSASEGIELTENEAAATGGTEKEEEEAGETEKGEEEEKSSEEGFNDEDEAEGQVPDVGFQTGMVFGSPFISVRKMQQYFFELERALHKVFENTLNEAAQNPNNTTTTTEEVTVNGHKYLVNRTVIMGGDEDSSVVIKAISMVPAQDRRKRAVMELW